MAGGFFVVKEPAATVAIFGVRGELIQRSGTGQNPGESSVSFGRPWRAPTIRPAKYRQASSVSWAPWVVRELSAAFAMASCGSRAKKGPGPAA